jgi:hypothetical protein
MGTQGNGDATPPEAASTAGASRSAHWLFDMSTPSTGLPRRRRPANVLHNGRGVAARASPTVRVPFLCWLAPAAAVGSVVMGKIWLDRRGVLTDALLVALLRVLLVAVIVVGRSWLFLEAAAAPSYQRRRAGTFRAASSARASRAAH